MNLRAAALLALVLTIIGTTTSLSAASAQTATAQDGLTAAFCTNLSLGGPRTYPFDSNGDGRADVCSLPYTRREAIARQNALERLARQYRSTFLTLVKQQCRLLGSQDFGDSAADLAKDGCATGTLTPSPTVGNQPPLFYSGVVSGPSFCANLSLGGPRTYPFDSNGDGIADVCSLPYTRREAIARQNALLKLAAQFQGDFNSALTAACAALNTQNADFGDSAADLAKDICQPSTRPGSGGGPGGGAPGGGAPGGGGPGARQPTAPGTPTSLRLIAAEAKITARWAAPANGGSPITDYDVQYRACTATDSDATVLTCATSPTWGSWTPHTHTGTATSTTIAGLTNGTAYQVRVRAQNSVGEGVWSTSSSPSGKATPGATPGQPDAPTLTVMNASLGVSWTAPANGGSPITGYKVGRCSANCGTDANWTVTTLNTIDTATTLDGLANGTAYQVRVAATNSIGDSDWSDSATATPVATPGKPDAPGLTVKDASLDVSWSAPADNGSAITDYDVQYRACTATPRTCATSPTWGPWTEWNASNTSTATTATITGLANGTAYQVQVRAQNSIGDSAWSDSATATPATKPGAPAAPTLRPHHQSLTVEWSAPADNGSAITDYDVQHRACTATPRTCATSPTWGPWTEWNASNTSTATTATITGLANGTAYQVQVRAQNSQDEGEWSASGEETPVATPGKPAAPGLTVKDASLDVSWSAPADNGSAITDYDVQYRACTLSTDLTCSNSSTATWESSWTALDDTGNNATDTATTATIDGLTNGTAYQVQVRAQNSIGDSAWSDSATATPATKPGAPAAPTLRPHHQSLTVEWSAPDDNGGSAITDYDVQYRACTATPRTCATSPTWGPWTEWNASNTSTATTATITGLANGTAYQVQVRAQNSIGDSAWSDSATATPVATPGKPAAPGLTVQDASLDVSWSAPADNGGSAIIDYDVRYSDDSGSTWTEFNSTNTSTATTATIDGLTNGTAYQVQVRAQNSIGDSAWSDSATATPATKPDAPTAPTFTYNEPPITRNGERIQNLGVSWSAPDDNGSAITDYDVQYRVCTATDSDTTVLTCATSPTWGSWTPHTHTGTATSTTINRLAEDPSRRESHSIAYQVQVRAHNSQGGGEWSTSGTAATVPSAPSGLSLTVENASLKVTWSAPSGKDTGGAAITGYRVRHCTDNDDGCSKGKWRPTDISAASTSTTLTGLTNGNTYQVQVRAKNTLGNSKFSSSKTATPATLPSAPSGLSLTVKNASLEVTWSAPDDNGSAITDYDVQHRACTLATDLTCANSATATWGTWTDRTGETTTDTATTATITGLTNGTAYQVQVRAQNSQGEGEWSTSGKATPDTTPGQPAAPTLTVMNASLKVVWDPPPNQGTAISDYDVQYRACTKSADLTCADSATATWGSWTDRTGETTTDTATSITITGLTNGTAYQVQVRAQNSVGEGEWSTSGQATPNVTPSQPFRPNVEPSETGGVASLTVTWTAPNDNGAVITDYDVQRATRTSGTWGSWTPHTHTGTATSTTIEGLTQGTVYRVRVRASNGEGDGNWSIPSIPRAAGKPNAPTVTVTVAHTALVVSWTTQNSTESVITGYDVQYRQGTSGTWTSHTHTGTATTATISGLTNGTAYQVQVRASNNAGDGTWSTAVSGTPNISAPVAPAAPTVKTDYQALVVSWTAPTNTGGSAITDYDVQHRFCSAFDKTCVINPSWNGQWWNWSADTATTVRITSLTNGTAYQVRVRAANSQGESSWSLASKGIPNFAPPGPPTGVTLSPGNSALTVQWKKPLLIGAPSTNYELRYRKCQHSGDRDCTYAGNLTNWETTWTEASNTSSTTTATLTGLTNGYAYQVQVRANNSNHTGDWSTTSAPLIPGTPSKPAEPRLVVGSGQITVTWVEPATNGSNIVNYLVYFRTGTANFGAPTEGTCTVQNTRLNRGCTITGLTNGTKYDVQIAAINSVGSSKWSDASSATPG